MIFCISYLKRIIVSYFCYSICMLYKKKILKFFNKTFNWLIKFKNQVASFRVYLNFKLIFLRDRVLDGRMHRIMWKFHNLWSLIRKIKITKHNLLYRPTFYRRLWFTIDSITWAIFASIRTTPEVLKGCLSLFCVVFVLSGVISYPWKLCVQILQIKS